MMRNVVLGLVARLAVSLLLVLALMVPSIAQGPAGLALGVFAGGAAVSYPLGWPSLGSRILTSFAASIVVSAGSVGLVIVVGAPLRSQEVVLATALVIVIAALAHAAIAFAHHESKAFVRHEIGMQLAGCAIAALAVLAIR